VWRIHFTSEDIARVRLARGVDPMWELQHSLHVLGGRTGELIFGPWRRKANRSGIGRWRPLLTLNPPSGYSPNFFTPSEGTTELRAGIETVLRTPRRVLERDLATLGGGRRLPTWTGPLAAGEPATLRGLARAMHGYFDTHLEPYWRQICRHVNDERHRLIRTVAHAGSESLLADASPLLRWERPVLTLTNKRTERDFWLDGRGLVLQPSFFAIEDSTILEVPDAPMVIAYPVRQRPGWLDAETGPREPALRALLGRTRAEALQVLGERRATTTELAERLELSVASASQHAKVLREAGLVASAAQGKAVVHSVSPLGAQLLEGHPAA
jgi:DNA-binding transcriptional ArsR family regulator